MSLSPHRPAKKRSELGLGTSTWRQNPGEVASPKAKKIEVGGLDLDADTLTQRRHSKRRTQKDLERQQKAFLKTKAEFAARRKVEAEQMHAARYGPVDSKSMDTEQIPAWESCDDEWIPEEVAVGSRCRACCAC